MRRITGIVAAVVLACTSGRLARAPSPRPRAAAPPTFALSVDSIMRGPKLVGYAPSDLRWSGDSTKLYFEWRLRRDEETSTWVVAREGGAPRRLSDEERRSAPPRHGEWNGTKRRALSVDQDDIVTVDSIARTRRAITRTSEAEDHQTWRLAVFPVENHSFEDEASWADEYKRILDLFETHLRGVPGWS